MSGGADQFKEMLRRSIHATKSQIESEDANAQILEDDYKRAQNILGYAFKIPDTWSDARQLLIAMIPKMEMAGYRNGWIQYLEKGLSISDAQQDIQSASELAIAIGYLELVQANFQVAEKWLDRAKEGFGQCGDEAGQGKALNRLARLKLDQEEYSVSAEFAQAALSMLGDADAERANSHYALGSVHRLKGELVDAESHYRTSLKIWSDANDQRRIAWGLGNLGIVFVQQKKYDAAVSHLTQALDMFEHVYDPANQAQAKNSLAVTYWQMKRLDDAAQLFIQAQKIFRRLGDELGVARVTNNLGAYFTATKQWDLAYGSYEQCLLLWEKLGLTASLCNSLDGLGEVYSATNNPSQAREIFQRGLDVLATIPDHPRYERLKKSLTVNRDEAKNG